MIRSDFESLHDVRLPTYKPLPQVSEFSVFLLHLTLFSRFHAFSQKKRVSVEISIEESLFMKNAEQKVPLHAKDTWLSRPAVLLILLK